jgi:hypothetical protein
MAQTEMNFGVFATAAANHAHRRNSPPVPDADGLFDLEGVTAICSRRSCRFNPVSELFGDVHSHISTIRTIRLVAIAPGKFDVTAIHTACTMAHGFRVYDVDYERSVPRNHDGLDEIRIARIVGATGVQPYVPKRGAYSIDRHSRTVLAIIGEPTRAFRNILRASEFRQHTHKGARLGLRALEDAGLMHIQLGPLGGMRKCTWTPRAYLATERLAPADEAALEMLA